MIDLCQLEISQTDFGAGSFHGISLAPLLKGETETLPERVVVTDSQRVEHPIKWKQSATMTQRWRLINGVELYDIEVDPEQRNDIAVEASGGCRGIAGTLRSVVGTRIAAFW